MKHLSIITLTTVFLSSPVFAGDDITADEIRALFSNKTFDIHNVKTDKHLTAYDSEDGSHLVYIPWKDKISERKWWQNDNQHCTSHPKRGDSCKTLKHMGDGIYHGFTDGKHTHTLRNFRAGNQL